MRHIVSILLQNEAGALARVASMFSNRGYNIESLSVAPTEDPFVSRLTLVTKGSDEVIQQINRQLHKLVDVVNIADMTTGDHMERELLLMKISVSDDLLDTASDRTVSAGGRVLDDSPASFTVELTSTGQRIDDFVERMSDCGQLLAVVRSGPMAIARGERVLSATA
jgi:acetolactate synthase-1/3 small subunit